VLAAAVLVPSRASAHGRSVSYSTWHLDGRRIDVSVRVADLDLTAAAAEIGAASAAAADSGSAPAVSGSEPGRTSDMAGSAVGEITAMTPHAPADPVAAYVARNVTASAGSQACTVVEPIRNVSDGNGWRSVAWTLECPESDAYTLNVDLLFDALPGHTHFARVDGAGRASVERLVTGERRTWTIAAHAGDTRAGTQGSSLAEYVGLGIRHILSGYDHIAFLVALLLLARTLGEVAWVVSSFTVAHSFTLALAALGLAHPNPSAIEALIGFSIALVAIENSWLLAGRPRFVPVALTTGLVAFAFAARAGVGLLPPVVFAGLALFCASHFSLMARVRDGTRLRIIVAFCFGLAHGFGFAGVLSEIAADPGRLVRALLGFNAGVELGQLAIVAAVWPLLLLAQRSRSGAPGLLIAEVGSALVCGLGTFWFLVRALG
jgi:hypothetical protein